MIKNNIKIIAIMIWLFFTLFPWQGWVENLSVFRFIVGLLVFIFPGALTFFYLSEDKNISARILLGGFVVSIFVMGLLGLFARLFQLNFLLIRWGFVLWGVAALFFFGPQKEKITWQFERFTWLDIGLLLVAAGSSIYFSSIANPPLIHDDAFSYNALLYYYQHAPVLDFNFSPALERLEIARFWIAYWPLVEAMISDLGKVDGLIVAGAYLPPALACLSFLGIYSLGRTLGFPRPVAGAAILAQGFSLMRLSKWDQPGNLFFQRLTEDKVVAAFVISIIFVMLVVEYLENPTTHKLMLSGIAALAMVFTHPVQFGMSCMIVGVYGLPSVFNKRIRVSYFSLIGVLIAILLVPYLFRFGGGEYSNSLSFSLSDVAINNDFGRLGRLQIIEGTQFYGIATSLMPGLPYEVSLLSAIVCLFFFWRYKFARYILSAFLVLGVSVFPYTGWIVGMFTTPFQLDRLTWLMPFGLAFAFLIWCGFEILQKIDLIRSRFPWVSSLYYLFVYTILVAALVWIRPVALENVESRNLNEVDVYNNYLRMAVFMNDLEVDQPIIVGGPDAVTNSIIPSITMKYEPLYFRVEVDSRRSQSWESLIGENDTPLEERFIRFRENRVEYLLLKGRPDWITDFSKTYPNNISLLNRDGRFSLYKITP